MKKIALILFIALGISGCASFDYETRPFFSGFGQKFDCFQDLNGNIFRARTRQLCSFERFGY